VCSVFVCFVCVYVCVCCACVVCVCVLYVFLRVCLCVCVNSWFLSPGENTTIDFEFNSASDVQDSRRYLF
jgi:hypothetical protein